jgi:hypothetical protein
MLRRWLLPLLVLLVATPAAQAAPDCQDTATPRALLEEQPKLESVAIDPLGRLLLGAPTGILVLDRPGAAPRPLATFEAPGGIVFDDAGNAIAGTGNSTPNGTTGDTAGRSGLVRIALDSGTVSPFASGLSMANGVARHPDGTIYATNSIGSNVDRVPPTGGAAQRGWAKVQSGNGVAIDRSGRWLYVAQTFRPAAIAQVDLRDPSRVSPYVEADPGDSSAGLDGMTIDAAGRLLVAANASGEVWRVEGAPPRICVVARGLPKFPDGPSAVAVGRAGSPFPPENAYVVTFDGHVYELANVARGGDPFVPAPPAGDGTVDSGSSVVPAEDGSDGVRRAPSVRVRVSPRIARVGRRTRFTITVERFAAPAWRPVRGARVRFARKAMRTNRAGRVITRRRFTKPGRQFVQTGAAQSVAVLVSR